MYFAGSGLLMMLSTYSAFDNLYNKPEWQGGIQNCLPGKAILKISIYWPKIVLKIFENY